MLQLNSAPSPNLAVAAANPASGQAAPAGEGVVASGPDGQSASPFAAALYGQLKQVADGKSLKLDPAQIEATPIAVQEAPRASAQQSVQATAEGLPQAPVDALGIMAAMLAGIAPAPPAAAPAVSDEVAAVQSKAKDDKGKIDDTVDTTTAATGIPVVIAAAIPAAPPAADKATAVADESTATRGSAQVGTSMAPSSSANLAGEAPAKAEHSADTGKQPHDFDALLATARDTQLAAGHNVASHAAPAPRPAAEAATTVTTPVGARGWDNEVGEKLTWMVGRQESRADLVLNPPQLGRIEVSLSVDGKQASAVFVSANPEVRTALENAVPRLREIFQDMGISLGQTQVGAESFQQSANNRENGDNSAPGSGRSGDSGNAIPSGLRAAGGTPAQWLRRGNGLVDTFA